QPWPLLSSAQRRSEATLDVNASVVVNDRVVRNDVAASQSFDCGRRKLVQRRGKCIVGDDLLGAFEQDGRDVVGSICVQRSALLKGEIVVSNGCLQSVA